MLGVAHGDVFFTETPPVATLKSHDMDGWKAGEGGPTGLNFNQRILLNRDRSSKKHLPGTERACTNNGW